MTTKIIYHHLRPDNADKLIGADVFDYPVDPKQLSDFVANAGHELVFATVNNKVIGMASGVIMLHPDKQPLLFINEVGVNDEWCRNGIATHLSNMLFEIGRERGCKGIWLATEIDNVEARALYSKLGGRETKDIVVCDWDTAMDD